MILKRIKTLCALSATAASLFLAGSVSAQGSMNLVANGDFELYDTANPTHQPNYFTDWTVMPSSGGAGTLIIETALTESGTHASDFLGSLPSKLSQTINTVAGQTYKLSFWATTTVADPIASLTATLSGGSTGTTQTIVPTTTITSVRSFQNYNYIFAAPNANSLFAFTGVGGSNGSVLLDNISITPFYVPPVSAPEAPSLLSLGGFLAIGGLTQLRRRSKSIKSKSGRCPAS